MTKETRNSKPRTFLIVKPNSHGILTPREPLDQTGTVGSLYHCWPAAAGLDGQSLSDRSPAKLGRGKIKTLRCKKSVSKKDSRKSMPKTRVIRATLTCLFAKRWITLRKSSP